jgi:molecular chaperone DnaJ
MESGEGIKISGQGEAAPFGGHPGDLIVRVRVKADPRFEREDHDVVSDVHVPFSTMVLGGSVEVDTLDGKETISVDAGTPAGTVIQLRQRGIAYARGGRGAHRLTLIPIIPKKLSREQKDLLQKLKEEGI